MKPGAATVKVFGVLWKVMSRFLPEVRCWLHQVRIVRFKRHWRASAELDVIGSEHDYYLVSTFVHETMCICIFINKALAFVKFKHGRTIEQGRWSERTNSGFHICISIRIEDRIFERPMQIFRSTPYVNFSSTRSKTDSLDEIKVTPHDPFNEVRH